MPYNTYKEFDEATGFAAKAGFQLTSMQVELVEQLIQWPKSLNKAEVGCGKTVLSTVTSLMSDREVTVITVPPILITGWSKWLRQVSENIVVYRGNPRERAKMLESMKTARWIICSHAIYRDDFTQICEAVKGRQYEAIVDECFTGETLVLTDVGEVPISSVVKNNRGSWALSLNSSTYVLEWKRIVRRLAIQRKKELLEVTHEYGKFVCTDSHKIAVFSEASSGLRWTEARNLRKGDILKVLSTNIVNDDLQLRSLPSELCSEKDSKSKILQHTLQDGLSEIKPGVCPEMEGLNAKNMGESPDKGYTSSRHLGEDEAEKPYEKQRVRREDEKHSPSHRAQARCERWEWLRTDKAAAKTVESATEFRDRVCDKHEGCKTPVSESSECLQGRHSNCGSEVSDRSGREFSRSLDKKGAGRAKRGNTEVSRVVSVKVYQQGGNGRHRSSDDHNSEVYDLEVEDNHNYFANGVMVSNCHALKNPNSQLFKKVTVFSAGDRHLQLLSGTPVSKPLDGYSYIKLKHPKTYRSYGHFEAIHVAERDFFKKPIAFCNLDMLAENLNLHTVSANKEEMHGYNLQPLMPDCSYDLDPEHYKLYAKLVDEQLLSFDDGSVIDASTSQKLRQALQQVVVNFDYFANDPTKKSRAYDVLDATIEEAEVDRLDKSKLIVWINYKRSARAVTAYCNKLGIKTVAAYSEADTEKSVQAFLEDEKTRILVAQHQSCGAGLNPQFVCSEALFMELSTVPLYMHQCMGRIHRVGQTRIPRFKFAVANNTVQVGLLNSLLNNDDLMQKVSPTKASIRDMLLGKI